MDARSQKEWFLDSWCLRLKPTDQNRGGERIGRLRLCVRRN
jgi:hypothetical protein